MIPQSSYLNAHAMAQQLREKGLSLAVKEGTVLQELVELSASLRSEEQSTLLPTILANRQAGNGSLMTAEERAIETYVLTSGFNGDSLHSLKLRALVNDIAPYVTSHISMARNVVVPIVVELGERLAKIKETFGPMNPASFFEIQACEIPAILHDESFIGGEIAEYRQHELSEPGWMTFAFPALEGMTAQQYVSLGNDRLDDLVGKWLLSMPEGFLDNIYKATFQQLWIKDQNDHKLTALSYSPSNPYTILNFALGTYLLLRKMRMEPVNIPSLSSERYKEELQTSLEFTLTSMWAAIKRIARQQENSVMVVEVNPTKKRVVVHKALYNPWLAEGGCPEVLLGMLVSGQAQYNLKAINEAKERLLKTWEKYVALSQADMRAELRRRFVQMAESETILGLNDLTDIEKEYLQDYPSYRETVAKRVKEELEHLSHRVMDDPMHTALHLVAKARFYFTNSYAILQKMEEVSKDNPSMDPREAALLSAIDYIADYMAKQVRVQR